MWRERRVEAEERAALLLRVRRTSLAARGNVAAVGVAAATCGLLLWAHVSVDAAQEEADAALWAAEPAPWALAAAAGAVGYAAGARAARRAAESFGALPAGAAAQLRALVAPPRAIYSALLFGAPWAATRLHALLFPEAGRSDRRWLRAGVLAASAAAATAVWPLAVPAAAALAAADAAAADWDAAQAHPLEAVLGPCNRLLHPRPDAACAAADPPAPSSTYEFSYDETSGTLSARLVRADGSEAEDLPPRENGL
jgi:hypothetical protein